MCQISVDVTTPNRGILLLGQVCCAIALFTAWIGAASHHIGIGDIVIHQACKTGLCHESCIIRQVFI
jgi:hypothetical protein